MQGELAALKEQQQELWAQHQEATTAADSAKSALAAAQRQVAVLEAQVVPLQREREGLARLVDVLQQGLADQAAGAHSSSQPQSTVGDTSDAVVAGVTSERVQLLEQAVKDLTSQQELLQEQYKAAGQAEAQQRQRADAAERSAAALERQVEALSQQCAQQQVSEQYAQRHVEFWQGLLGTVTCTLTPVDTMPSSDCNVQWGVMPYGGNKHHSPLYTQPANECVKEQGTIELVPEAARHAFNQAATQQQCTRLLCHPPTPDLFHTLNTMTHTKEATPCVLLTVPAGAAGRRGPRPLPLPRAAPHRQPGG